MAKRQFRADANYFCFIVRVQFVLESALASSFIVGNHILADNSTFTQ